jgi:hypothetical protein
MYCLDKPHHDQQLQRIIHKVIINAIKFRIIKITTDPLLFKFYKRFFLSLLVLENTHIVMHFR